MILVALFSSADPACAAPYDDDYFGGDDFAIWADSAALTGERCADSLSIKMGIDLYLKNFGCTDKVRTRAAKRWGKIAAKISKVVVVKTLIVPSTKDLSLSDPRHVGYPAMSHMTL